MEGKTRKTQIYVQEKQKTNPIMAPKYWTRTRNKGAGEGLWQVRADVWCTSWRIRPRNCMDDTAESEQERCRLSQCPRPTHVQHGHSLKIQDHGRRVPSLATYWCGRYTRSSCPILRGGSSNIVTPISLPWPAVHWPNSS